MALPPTENIKLQTIAFFQKRQCGCVTSGPFNAPFSGNQNNIANLNSRGSFCAALIYPYDKGTAHAGLPTFQRRPDEQT